MNKVISKDGTPIAFDQSGEGPPIILVVGAFNDSSTGAPLAAQLSEHFTVFNYDRRGRGASGDRTPYAIEREIEDLAFLTKLADRHPCSGIPLVLSLPSRRQRAVSLFPG